MKQILPDLLLDGYIKGRQSDSFNAYVVNADIAGFTLLSGILSKNRDGAIEFFSDTVSSLYNSILEVIEKFNGYFLIMEGDSITSTYSRKESAISAAHAIVELFNQCTIDYAGKTYRISVRTGVSYGKIDCKIFGRDKESVFYFAGFPLVQAAKAASEADLNSVKISDTVILQKHDDDLYQPLKITMTEDLKLQLRFLDEADLSNFAPSYTDTAIVFIQILHDSIDFWQTVKKLQKKYFLYGLRIYNQDKGLCALLYSGAPYASESYKENSVNFSLDLISKFGSDIKIGIYNDRIYRCWCGNERYGDYICFGQSANLATRLCQSGNWGKISTAGCMYMPESYIYKDRGCSKIKGENNDLKCFYILHRSTTPEFRLSSLFVGRKQELETLIQRCKILKKRKCAGMILLYGSAGSGKTRLLTELKKYYSGLRFFTLRCKPEEDSAIRTIRHAFYSFWGIKTVFEPSKDLIRKTIAGVLENIQESPKVTQVLKEEILRNNALLYTVFDLSDTGFAEEFESSINLRYFQLFKNLIKAESLIDPLVIIAEDLHWAGLELKEWLINIFYKAGGFPLMLAVSSRHDMPEFENNSVALEKIRLGNLDYDSAEEIISGILTDKANRKLISTIYQKSGGNPLFIEQLSLYIKENYVDNGLDFNPDKIEIPEGIAKVIMARLHRLPLNLQFVIKNAAILGAEFITDILTGMLLRQHNTKKLCNKCLKNGEKERIWESLGKIRYLFSHVLIRDTAYDMQLKKQLKVLHTLAAEVMEEHFGDCAEYYFDIAKHYDSAGIDDKAKLFYTKSLDFNLKRYFNDDALSVAEKIVKYADNDYDLIKINRHRISLLKLSGKSSEAGEIALQNIAAAERLKDKNLFYSEKLSYNEISFIQGENNEEILMQVHKICDYFKNIDKSEYSKGLILMSSAYMRSAQFSDAIKVAKELHAVSCSENSLESEVNANSMLGLVYHNMRDHKTALKYHFKQLSAAEKLGSKQQIAKAANSIGVAYAYDGSDWDQVSLYYNKALNLYKEIGNLPGCAMVEANTGVIYRVRKEHRTALQHYEKSLELAISSKTINLELSCYLMMATDYNSLEDIKKAQYYYHLALNKSIKHNIANYQVFSYEGLFSVHLNLGRYKKALEFVIEGIKTAIKYKMKNETAFGFSRAGDCCHRLGWHKKAISYFQKVKPSADNIIWQIGAYAKIIDISLFTGETRFGKVYLQKLKRLIDERVTDQKVKQDGLFRLKLLEASYWFKLDGVKNKNRILESIDELKESEYMNSQYHALLLYSLESRVYAKNEIIGNEGDLISISSKFTDKNYLGKLYHYCYLIARKSEYKELAISHYNLYLKKQPDYEYKNLLKELTAL